MSCSKKYSKTEPVDSAAKSQTMICYAARHCRGSEKLFALFFGAT
jgi:hypothetical protein